MGGAKRVFFTPVFAGYADLGLPRSDRAIPIIHRRHRAPMGIAIKSDERLI
jgi:hypothetical protein